ncbi:MAG: hypothetical protein RLZ44_11, partial [Pseudomonadota bacterium]
MPHSPACPKAYQAFRRWLALLGLLLFAVYLTWEAGLLSALLATDRSHLSLLILTAFAVATAHAGWRAWMLGRETCLAQQLRDRIRDHLAARNPPPELAGLTTGPSYAHEHLGFLMQ